MRRSRTWKALPHLPSLTDPNVDHREIDEEIVEEIVEEIGRRGWTL
jgi:hypothetical protein